MTTGAGVELTGITKSFGATRALVDVNVSIPAGAVHGLAGPNGSGKSTLLKVLVGIHRPDAGVILLDGQPIELDGPLAARRVGIELVPQEVALAPAMTVWENVVLGSEPRRSRQLHHAEARRRTRETMTRLGVDIDVSAPVGQLNPAEQRLVMVARGLQRQPRLLIADEPTAGVPPAQSIAIVRALAALSKHGVTVVFVSHDLEEMAGLCDTATVLVDGRVRVALDSDQVHTKALISALVEQTTVAAVVDDDVRSTGSVGTELLRVSQLGGSVLHPVDLSVRRGEVLGVAGLLGSGRDEIIDLIVGTRPRTGGRVVIGEADISSPVDATKAGVGYLHGDRAIAAIPGWSVCEHLTLPGLTRWRRQLVIDRKREHADAAAALSALSVKASATDMFSSLSGGNQQRALLARWIANECRVLLVDEPCVGVDINSRAELLRVIRKFAHERGVIVASSDPADLVATCDRVLCLVDGVVAVELAADEISERAILSAINNETDVPEPDVPASTSQGVLA